MSEIRVLVADDEAPARAKLCRLIGADKRFILVGEARDGLEALAQIETLAPALLILDVQMPGLTGFELLEALGPDACPEVIFSTAYDRYAIAAFDAAAVDYLLKPYDAPRFARALDKAFLQLTRDGAAETPLHTLLANVQAPLERFLVKSGGAWLPVALTDVWRLSAEENYVRLFSHSGEHLVRHTLKNLEVRLDPRRFVRVHRKDIVALPSVARLEPLSHGDALLVLSDGGTVVLSRTYREAFVQRWGMSG
jgi:two-component system LytT family response regulator